MYVPQVNKYPYEFLVNSLKRINWLLGGASAGKSWTIVQFLILERICKMHDIGILCLRKTKPSVKSSCMRLFIYWLTIFGIPNKINKSDFTITCPNNNILYFDSLDDIEKKKSIEGINYIWMEETTQFTLKEFMRLNIGCRAKNTNTIERNGKRYKAINQIFGSFNPIDPIANKWLKDRTDNPPEDEQVMVLIYKDNPFLNEEEVKVIEKLVDQDYEYDKIYRQGLWATPTNLIYTKWEIIRKWPVTFDEVIYGLDFGFNNETALLELGTYDMIPYERELLYEKNLTNSQLIERLESLVPNKNKLIVADSAEPQRIKEIQNKGFNCVACKKGKDSIRRGIDLIKRNTPQIDYHSPNLIEELNGYKWKVTKSEVILDEPVKYKDHLMDARRYAYERMFDKTEVKLTGLNSDNEPHVEATGEEITAAVSKFEAAFEADDDASVWEDF